jgi:cell wall-associated NlpC family hydrolase
VSRVADAALAAVGARFRLHGRDPATGLDCVGLAALALRAGGYAGAVPTGYRLRGEVPAALLDAAMPRCGGERPGDLLLFRSGPGQGHLGVRTARGFVHADAGIGRVVERAGAAPWPLVAAWRWEG